MMVDDKAAIGIGMGFAREPFAHGATSGGGRSDARRASGDPGAGEPARRSEASREIRAPALPDRLPDKPSQPLRSIFRRAAGFSAPGPLYLGQRNSLVSLDFLDEDRLLFTFRVPGLIRREAGEEDARQIRAVFSRCLQARSRPRPSGQFTTAALPGMLTGGRFLLRDRDNLEMATPHWS